MTTTAYLAAEGYADELREELRGEVVAAYGRLLAAAGPPRPVAWACNVWQEPQEVRVASVAEAARALRAIQRNWAPYAFHLHRRMALIQGKLPPPPGKPLVFPSPLPKVPMGSWTLLAPDLLLCAPRCSSRFANGEIRFAEDRSGPPNRAYLKLWEALTLLGEWPRPGETCIDLGSSPGGWTWAAARLGARVISVDKAPLDPAVASLPNVEFRRASAFSLAPEPVDWLFCDVVAYPRRLLGLVRRWLEGGAARRAVCTVKFQGRTDHAAAREFASLADSRLVHLHHNKHELTWLWPFRFRDMP